MASSAASLTYTADRAEELNENIQGVLGEVEQAAKSDARPAGKEPVRSIGRQVNPDSHQS
jgi:hypothetical protein